MAKTSEKRFSEKVKKLQEKLLTRALDQANREGGSDKLLNLVLRNLSNRVNSIRLGSQQSFDVGKLMAYPKAHDNGGISMSKVLHMNERFRNVMSAPTHIPVRANALPEQNASYYAQMERFHRVMNGDFRQSLVIGDDEQYAFGAPTGVSEDFSYLRDIENQQTERRDYRNRARANAYSAIRDYELEGEDAVAQNRARVRAQRQEQREESRMRESRRSIAVRSKQIESYRKFPWVKSLVDAGVIQKKELPKITKSLNRMSKNPFLGHIVKNPALAIPLLAYGAIVKGLSLSDNANRDVVDWKNSANLHGTPSRKFAEAAFMAGLKDPGQIAELYGKLTAKFGNADAILEGIGSRTGKMSPLARMAVAKSMGWDDKTMAIADILSDNGHLKIDRTRRMNANKNMIEAADKMGWSSSGGWGDTAQSLWWLIPGMKSAAARDAADFDYTRKDLIEGYFKTADEHIKAAGDAAQSADEYDSGKIGNKQSSNAPANVSKSVAFNIGTLQVDAENTEGLMRSLMKEGSVRDHIGVIDTMDMRIRC